MKKLIIIGMLILGLCSFAMGDTTITCPNDNILSMDWIYTKLVPSDFPPELCSIFCTIPFNAAPLEKYPQILMGVASMSGTPQDQIIIVWFLDMTMGKYIAFIEYDSVKKKHTILWVSKFASDEFTKFVYSIVNEANNSESF